MIVTDYNKMTVEELNVISIALGVGFLISDGEITAAVKEEEE